MSEFLFLYAKLLATAAGIVIAAFVIVYWLGLLETFGLAPKKRKESEEGW